MYRRDYMPYFQSAWPCSKSQVTFKDFKVTHLPRNYAAMRKALDSNVTMEWLDE